MADAPRDHNNIPGRLACLFSDAVQGTTLVPIRIVEATGAIRINTTNTVQFTMQPVDPRDKNYVDVWLFQGTDGLTYPAVCDAEGRLLIDS